MTLVTLFHDGHPDDVVYRPERTWPRFSNPHALLNWYAGRLKVRTTTEAFSTFKTSAPFRQATAVLRRYLKQNALHFDENCWTRWIALKSDDGVSYWSVSDFSPAVIGWSSRGNDLLLLGLVELTLTCDRQGMVAFCGAVPKLVRVLKWIATKPDLLIDLPPCLKQVYSLCTTWHVDPRGYWQNLKNRVYSEEMHYLIPCTYALLPKGFKPSFVSQVDAHGVYSTKVRAFLFNAFTEHQLWHEKDWAPRVLSQRSYVEQCRGLTWSSSHEWNNTVRTPGMLGRVLTALPDYARQLLLEDVLTHPRDGVLHWWPHLLKLTLTRREQILRLHTVDTWKLRQLHEDCFDMTEMPMLAYRVMMELLPEHAELWHQSEALGLNMEEMFLFLDTTRSMPKELLSADLPEDFSF